MKKRRHRKRRTKPMEKSNYLMKFVPAVVIIILAILLGYGTARFVVGPICGYDLAQLKLNFSHQWKDKSEKPEKSAEKEAVTGYALQFGFYSKEGKAKATQSQLKKYGIKTSIVKSEDGYMIIGDILETKEEALEALNNIDKTKDIDVFIKKITKGK